MSKSRDKKLRIVGEWQTAHPGYYPGYSTMSQRRYWDEATRKVIEERVEKIPPIRFFTADELPTITAVTDRIIPQDDRTPEARIPIVNQIDKKLYENEIDGYRFADMLPERDAYRLGLRALDEIAQKLYGKRFAETTVNEQDNVLKTIHDGKPPAGAEVWERMSVERFWHTLVQDCVTVYYAHPRAWDEIGYGGPAYPRAYTRLEGGMPEPWEVDEQRYEWIAPDESLSDVYEDLPTEHMSVSGQGGTH